MSKVLRSDSGNEDLVNKSRTVSSSQVNYGQSTHSFGVKYHSSVRKSDTLHPFLPSIVHDSPMVYNRESDSSYGRDGE